MYKIAVMGESESVLGFGALGLEVFPAEGENEARETFRSLARGGDYAIIYITERYYEALKTDIDRFKDSAVPAVIVIPGTEGASGIGKRAIDDAVERAIGANII